MTMDPRIPMPGDPNYDPGAFQTPAPWYTGPPAALPPAPPPPPIQMNPDPGGFQQPGPPPAPGTGVETPSTGFPATPDPTTLPGYVMPPGIPAPPSLPSFTPPAPPDISGYRPESPNIPMLPNTSTRPFGGGQSSSGGDRNFNLLRSLDNFQPDFPAWVRGLQRSPYAQYAQHNATPFAAPPRGMLRYEEDPYTPTPPPPWAVLGA